MTDTLTTLQNSIEALTATQKQLNSLTDSQIAALSPEEQTKRTDQLANIETSILKLEGSMLGAVNSQFTAQLPQLEEATAKLTNALNGMSDTVQTINAVSSSLDTITEIAKLV